jgi:hypothetical protein
VKMKIQEVRDGILHWISTRSTVSLVEWTGKDGWCFMQCGWTAALRRADLEGWLKKNLRSTDHVVFESTTNAWHVYDLLEPLVERVVMANPAKVKQIATARVKTDVRDTFILARLRQPTWSRMCGYPLSMSGRCVSYSRSADNWWRHTRRS